MTEGKSYEGMSKEERDAHDQQQREKEKKEQAGELSHFLGGVVELWLRTAFSVGKHNCISTIYQILTTDLIICIVVQYYRIPGHKNLLRQR